MHHKFIDQYSHLDSFLHRVDPRVKIVVFMAIICCIVLTSASCLQSLYLYGVMLLFFVFISKLSWRFIVVRLLVFFPFVALLGLSVFFESGPLRVNFFVFILLRSFLSLLSMLLLVSTTHFADLLKGLEKMRCPRLLLMIFSFMYRYFYLFSDQLMKMNRSREARLGGERRWTQVRAMANMIGCLFVKSYEISEGVYLAMCARGYAGEIVTARSFKLKLSDYGLILGVFIYVFLVNIWSYI